MPAAGAKDADVTIVEFFDYNCPFCKKTAPELLKLLHVDPKVRILYKEWPIFGDVSEYAARSALAANWQGKFLTAHDALIGAAHDLDDNSQVDAVLKSVGVDLTQLARDRTAHATEITAILARNAQEASRARLPGNAGHCGRPSASAPVVDCERAAAAHAEREILALDPSDSMRRNVIGCDDDKPPSTAIACPLTYDAASDARNNATCAISSGPPGSPQWIELTYFAFAAAGASLLEYRPRHTGFNQPGADGVDPYTGSRQLIGRRLHETDDTGLARAVRHTAGARTQSGDRCRTDDGASLLTDHFQRRILCGEKRADEIDLQNLRPTLRRLLEERRQATADARRWQNTHRGRRTR